MVIESSTDHMTIAKHWCFCIDQTETNIFHLEISVLCPQIMYSFLFICFQMFLNNMQIWNLL